MAAGDDAESLDHLPKNLQRPAKAFYEAIEVYYRDAIGAEEDGTEAASGPTGVRPMGISFYDHYHPGEATLSAPVMTFIDWMIFSDGIGAEENEFLAESSRGRMHDFTRPRVGFPEADREPGQTREFLARLEHLGANPYAQHLRGVFLYCGVGGASDQDAGHGLILEAARGNYIGALRFLNAIRRFDDRDKEQKRLKWALEDLDKPENFIEGFIRRRESSLEEVRAETFERLERIVLNYCSGDNDKLWAIYRDLTPMVFSYFKSLQSPLGDLEKGLAQNVVISGTALGVSIAWVISEPGLEPVLSTTISSLSLASSTYALIRNGSFYRGMSYFMCCCSERFREWAPMDLEDDIINREARLASLLAVIRFADKFQGRDFETAESAAHKIRLALGAPALAGTGSLAKQVFDKEDILS